MLDDFLEQGTGLLDLEWKLLFSIRKKTFENPAYSGKDQFSFFEAAFIEKSGYRSRIERSTVFEDQNLIGPLTGEVDVMGGYPPILFRTRMIVSEVISRKVPGLASRPGGQLTVCTRG